MKIMYLNPLGLPDYDQTFADMARQYKEPDNEVHVCSLNPSVGAMNNLEYRTYEALVTGDIIKATRQAAVDGFDALVIGCFYDPSLDDARQIGGGMIVVAPCQSSVETALRLSSRYSIIIGQWLWHDQMYETVRRYGYEQQLASFRSVDMSVEEMVANPEEAATRIQEQASQAIAEDKAETIVLGCTLEIGFYQTVQAAIGVPVIDPSIAALKAAEHGAAMKALSNWRTSPKWGMAPPSEADLARFGILQTPYVFGNTIVVT